MIATRTAPNRAPSIAGKTLPGEGLNHHAIGRATIVQKPDETPPHRHSGDKALGAVDRIEHPNIFCFALKRTEFLADDAVMRERRLDQTPHRRFCGTVRLGHGIEHASGVFVLGAERGTKERQNRIGRDIGKLLDESGEIHGCHWLPVPVAASTSSLPRRRTGVKPIPATGGLPNETIGSLRTCLKSHGTPLGPHPCKAICAASAIITDAVADGRPLPWRSLCEPLRSQWNLGLPFPRASRRALRVLLGMRAPSG